MGPTPSARRRAHVVFTTRSDGDLHADHVHDEVLAHRWRRVSGRPTTWLDECHGAEVLVVGEPGGGRGVRGDAAVTAVPEVALGIWVGDCAPVAFIADGVVAAVHAGWRSLMAGIVANTVESMRSLGATSIRAVLGPCIHPGCYEFGVDDLDLVTERLGPTVRSSTSWGAPALDVPAAVQAATSAEGIDLDQRRSVCTACSGRFWSHRARGELGRQGMAVWMEQR